ncbi:hypothetical protein ACHFJ0_08305 [Paracoccus sp. NGMCC 1.201697]|uniref:Membrane-anchored protein n=1 Tax=Paracoccus broussonetiae subsp. drimophilus TaxID=3373869 RepID=A0ABW7LIS8_9RHOB
MTVLLSLSRARRYAYRFVKFHLAGARAPRLDTLEGKTVVVVGSAPFSTRPMGWNPDFRVLTINASQIAAQGWLTQQPDVTLMQFNQIEGTNSSAVDVRRVLQHRRTGILFMLHWRHDLERLRRGLASFDYGHDQVRLMGRYERIALMREVTGRLNVELEADTKWSNGIVGAALAIHSGAANVILTGIDPASTGHAYNDLAHPRLHASMDLGALKIFRQRGYPLFTADPHVAERTQLPLWTG